MKCVIEGNGIKVFGKAVQALSRIGEEIWLDPMEEGLAVRTVNSSQSAYACFYFTPLFFQQYNPDPDTQKDCDAVKCKLNIKCVLPLFRCVAWRERSVDRCEISIKIPDSRVIFQFHCRHGITKTHNLGYQECEALQAVFPAHLCPNVLKAQSKLLGDIVVHFPISQEEVTLFISSFKVTLKTFYEEENSYIKGMNTEMMMHPDEFDYFQVGEDSAVTFCLKELRVSVQHNMFYHVNIQDMCRAEVFVSPCDVCADQYMRIFPYSFLLPLISVLRRRRCAIIFTQGDLVALDYALIVPTPFTYVFWQYVSGVTFWQATVYLCQSLMQWDRCLDSNQITCYSTGRHTVVWTHMTDLLLMQS